MKNSCAKRAAHFEVVKSESKEDQRLWKGKYQWQRGRNGVVSVSEHVQAGQRYLLRRYINAFLSLGSYCRVLQACDSRFTVLKAFLLVPMQSLVLLIHISPTC